MTAEEIERAAHQSYDLCPTVKPDWSQLGEITKSVWREMVVPKANSGETASSSIQGAAEASAGPQGALF